jgi:hypothetical protein
MLRINCESAFEENCCRETQSAMATGRIEWKPNIRKSLRMDEESLVQFVEGFQLDV